MILRPYQIDDKRKIYQSWDSGHQNVIYVLPTGGGKTVVLSSIVKEFDGYQIILAHRQELVSQISLTLASNQIRHNLISPDKLVKEISVIQVETFRRSYVDPSAKTIVAGIDTIVRRLDKPEFKRWSQKIKRWVIDEAHHVLKDNKWGKVVQAFPNAQGLGVTATPIRSDGCGLGEDNDGVFHSMVTGPTMHQLMNLGSLTQYRIFCIETNDLDLSTVTTDRTGDFNKVKLSEAIKESTIVGNAVSHYLKYARGLRGLTFCTDIETAKKTADSYRQAGVPAMLVTAKTKIADRANAFKRLKSGELLQLVNVGIFTEGVDVPSVIAISMMRPTKSLSLFMQQFGRGLRPSDGKTHAIIFDHVGNVLRHGLPDVNRSWDLERRRLRNSVGSQIFATVCEKCFSPFDSRLSQCPFCGTVKTPTFKSFPEEVQGDLLEINPSIIAQMRADRDKLDNPLPAPTSQGEIVRLSVLKRQRIRKEKQIELRSRVAQWAGNLKYLGIDDHEIYRRFYTLTGVDILKAQTLGATDSGKLMEKLV